MGKSQMKRRCRNTDQMRRAGMRETQYTNTHADQARRSGKPGADGAVHRYGRPQRQKLVSGALLYSVG